MKPKTMEAIQAHALEEYPKESCGVIVAVGRKEVYHPCRNIADNPQESFVIDPKNLKAAYALGRVVAVVHSHPDATPHPSPADAAQCAAWGLPWVIVAVHTDPAAPGAPPYVAGDHVMTPQSYEVPLRGREFIFGRQDCYTLVRDFYSREMGIELPDFERKDKFWERGENLYMDNFRDAGFQEIAEPSQKGDLILMAIRSDIVNHAGVWLGEKDAMLHHPYEHLSERVVFGGYWLENKRLYIRKVS